MGSTPCTFFQRGFCRFGASCRFAHVAADSYSSPFHHRKVYPVVAKGGKEPSSSPHPATTTHAHGSSTFPIEKKWHFNVMSYNILADEYAKEHQRELYSTVPWSALDWNRRKSLIVKEVDQWKPDVVCLQEVDHYNELADALAKKGYDGLYTQRTGGRPDGLATFWRNSTFKLAGQDEIMFTELGLKDNVSQLLVLEWNLDSEPPVASPAKMTTSGNSGGSSGSRKRSRQEREVHSAGQGPGSSSTTSKHIYFQDSSDEDVEERIIVARSTAGTSLSEDEEDVVAPARKVPAIVIANIHVLFNPKRGDIKLAQVRTMLERANLLSKKHGAKDRDHLPVVVCGDFNSATGSPLYDFVLKGELDLGETDRRKISGQVESQGIHGWPGLRHRFLSALSYHERNGSHNLAMARNHIVSLESLAMADAGSTFPPYNSMMDPYNSLADAPLLRMDGATAALRSSFVEQNQSSPVPGTLPGANRSSNNPNWWVGHIDRAGSNASGLSQASSMSTPTASGSKIKIMRPWSEEDLSLAMGRPFPSTSQLSINQGGGSRKQSKSNLHMGGSDKSSALSLNEISGGSVDMVVRHPLQLASAYSSTLGQEPHYSTVHDRYVGNVDYIFYTPQVPAYTEGRAVTAPRYILQPYAVLQPPSLKTLRTGLPSNAWPSDHISLFASFELQDLGPSSPGAN